MTTDGTVGIPPTVPIIQYKQTPVRTGHTHQRGYDRPDKVGGGGRMRHGRRMAVGTKVEDESTGEKRKEVLNEWDRRSVSNSRGRVSWAELYIRLAHDGTNQQVFDPSAIS